MSCLKDEIGVELINELKDDEEKTTINKSNENKDKNIKKKGNKRNKKEKKNKNKNKLISNMSSRPIYNHEGTKISRFVNNQNFVYDV